MNPLAAAAAWCDKSLAQLRAEAEREPTGVAFDALRPTGGPRLMLVVCITGQQVQRLLQSVTVVEEGQRPDWHTVSLAAFAAEAARTKGLAWLIERDSSGLICSLAISAAGPDSISKLESWLNL